MGNLYAFWIDDSGKQKIVHLCSEGDNLLILGNDFLEFFQYLSIGYADPEISDLDCSLEKLELKKKDKELATASSIEPLSTTKIFIHHNNCTLIFGI